MSGVSSAARAVTGVALAAGRSSRMGTAKPLLHVGTETFLARAVRVLREGGCATVLVVVPAADPRIGRAAEAAGARAVTNPAPASEQVDSLRLALRGLGEAAVLVLPVDLPFVLPETAAAVIAAWRESGAPLVVPELEGVAGHPVLLARALFPAVLEGALPEGLRSLLRAHARDAVSVPVDDPGILVDLDTPGDLHRHGVGA